MRILTEELGNKTVVLQQKVLTFEKDVDYKICVLNRKIGGLER